MREEQQQQQQLQCVGLVPVRPATKPRTAHEVTLVSVHVLARVILLVFSAAAMRLHVSLRVAAVR